MMGKGQGDWAREGNHLKEEANVASSQACLQPSLPGITLLHYSFYKAPVGSECCGSMANAAPNFDVERYL